MVVIFATRLRTLGLLVVGLVGLGGCATSGLSEAESDLVGTWVYARPEPPPETAPREALDPELEATLERALQSILEQLPPISEGDSIRLNRDGTFELRGSAFLGDAPSDTDRWSIRDGHVVLGDPARRTGVGIGSGADAGVFFRRDGAEDGFVMWFAIRDGALVWEIRGWKWTASFEFRRSSQDASPVR